MLYLLYKLSNISQSTTAQTQYQVLQSYTYYGAVLPRRRPHHVLILSVCLSRAFT